MLVHGTVQSMSPCGTNINGNVMVDQLFIFVALAPSPPVQSVGYDIWKKIVEIVLDVYLGLVELININI